AEADGSEPGGHATWWRAHQTVIALLYIIGATLAWQNKEWVETPVTVAIFLALGAAATIGGVLRGHLVFTSLMNPPRLTKERRPHRSTPPPRPVARRAAVRGRGGRGRPARAPGGVRARARRRRCDGVARARAGDDRCRIRRGTMIAIEIREPGEPDVLVPVER